jgi:hypothetical protein
MWGVSKRKGEKCINIQIVEIVCFEVFTVVKITVWVRRLVTV